MPAPANDNFQNATVLPNTQSGSVTSNNREATAQPNEPDGGGGHSVWFKFTPPISGEYYFTTRNSVADGGTLATNYDTIVSAFTSRNGAPSGADADEPQTNDAYAGWSKESFVHKSLGAGQDYFIRVDGPTTGDFKLRWGRFYNRFLHRGCYIRKNTDGLRLMGCARLVSINAENIVGFGAFQEAFYWIRYCSGAFRYDIEHSQTDWVTVAKGGGFDGVLFGGFWFVQIEYGAPNNQRAGQPFIGVGQAQYATEHEAEVAARCAAVVVDHKGGDIDVHFIDRKYTDNLEGTSRPAFSCFLIVPKFIVERQGATNPLINSPGVAGDNNVFFGFRMVSSIPIPAVTFTVLAGGGISVGSFIVTAFARRQAKNVGALSYTLSQSGNSLIKPKVRITVGSLLVGDFQFDLTPTLTAINPIIALQSINGPTNHWRAQFRINNDGESPTLRKFKIARHASSINITSIVAPPFAQIIGKGVIQFSMDFFTGGDGVCKLVLQGSDDVNQFPLLEYNFTVP